MPLACSRSSGKRRFVSRRALSGTGNPSATNEVTTMLALPPEAGATRVTTLTILAKR